MFHQRLELGPKARGDIGRACLSIRDCLLGRARTRNRRGPRREQASFQRHRDDQADVMTLGRREHSRARVQVQQSTLRIRTPRAS